MRNLLTYERLDESIVDEMERQALELLRDRGIELLSESALRMIAAKPSLLPDGGAWLKDGRVRFSPEFIREFYLKNREGTQRASRERFMMGICDMPQYYLVPGGAGHSLMTVRSLIDATRFMDAAADAIPGVWAMVPGVPRDVPPRVQMLCEMLTGIEYGRGGNIDSMHPPEAMPYLFQIAEALGGRIDVAGMFTISPLKMGGLEFDTAIQFIDHFTGFSLSTLPIPGMSAPLMRFPAWVLSIAEALGGAALLHLLSGGKHVDISTGMFPYDLRTAQVAGGMPEHAIMEYERGVIAPRYNPAIAHSHSMTTGAHVIGAQSGAEKAAGAMFAAAMGCREYNTLGLLGFDDIMSPAQFLLDVETLNLIERLSTGTMQPAADTWRLLIDEGLERGYLDTDSTLESYREAMYLPELFDRRVFRPDEPTRDDAIRHANGRAAEMIYAHKPHPPAQIERVRAIFDEAFAHLAPGVDNPYKPLRV